MQRFEGAVAIVTGGGMGLGEALCEELGRRGAKVVVADIDATPHVRWRGAWNKAACRRLPCGSMWPMKPRWRS